MKVFCSSLCLTATLAFSLAAHAFDLKDPAILGEYILSQPNPKAEIQRAELIYNSDNQLVIRSDRFADGYQLSGPDQDGVIFKGEDEANCDGGEYSCSYDASTVIKLLSTKNADGNFVPQISIQITVSYAWAMNCGGLDEDGKDQPACEDEVQTFILNWNKELAYSIPYYTNFDNSPQRQMNKACLARLKGLTYNGKGARYLNAYDVCGHLHSFQYRDDFAVAFPYVLQDWLGGNQDRPREVRAQEISAVFAQAKSLARTYQSTGTTTKEMILDEIEKLKSSLLQFNRFFVVPSDKGADKIEFFAVDTTKKIIVRLEIRIK